MSVDTKISELVERNAIAAQVLHRAAGRVRDTSPCCGQPLQGSSMRWCGACGHTISPAELDHEHRPRSTEVTTAVRTAVTNAVDHIGRYPGAADTIAERVTQQIQAGHRSWARVAATVMDLCDDAAYHHDLPYTISNRAAALTTAAIDAALRPRGLTCTTDQDRSIARDAGIDPATRTQDGSQR